MIEKTKITLFDKNHSPGHYPAQYYGGADRKVYVIIEVSNFKFVLRRLIEIMYDYEENKLIFPKDNNPNYAYTLGGPDEHQGYVNSDIPFESLYEAETFLDEFIHQEIEQNSVTRTKFPVKKKLVTTTITRTKPPIKKN